MSALVAIFAVSHVPGHTVNPDMVPRPQMAGIQAAWSRLQIELSNVRPDVVVAVSNDHFLNFFPVQPAFCVGTGEAHAMPSTACAKYLKIPSRDVRGNPSFAEHLLHIADSSGFPLAFSDEFVFNDEIAIPQRFLDPENRFSWLPILTNCLNRNRPSPESFFRLGDVIARSIREDKADRRVALVAAGGLSHDPFGPNWCLIDEAFDRRFLALLEAGKTDTLFAEFTPTKILEPGRGGTPEILNWFTALGAAGAGTRAVILSYEAVPTWATGVAYAFWPLAAGAC
jgi:hypothetical protein